MLEAAMIPEYNWGNDWRTLLATWAVMHKCSVWQKNHRCIAPILIYSELPNAYCFESCLHRVCTPELAEELAAELLVIGHHYEDYRLISDSCLFQILKMEKPLPERMLRCILKRLFRESVNVHQIRQIYRFLDGPNGPYFAACVEMQYMRSVNYGKTDFLWIMAVIQMHRLEGNRDLILAAARRNEAHAGRILREG